VSTKWATARKRRKPKLSQKFSNESLETSIPILPLIEVHLLLLATFLQKLPQRDSPRQPSLPLHLRLYLLSTNKAFLQEQQTSSIQLSKGLRLETLLEQEEDFPELNQLQQVTITQTLMLKLGLSLDLRTSSIHSRFNSSTNSTSDFLSITFISMLIRCRTWMESIQSPMQLHFGELDREQPNSLRTRREELEEEELLRMDSVNSRTLIGRVKVMELEIGLSIIWVSEEVGRETN
jgi:hypothetical protein